jgi:hypothetical protein
MEKLKKKIEDAGSTLYELYETESELRKLQTIEKISEAFSISVAGIAVLVVGFFALVFASLALAAVISEKAGHSYVGFLSVGGFYLVLCILFFVFRDRWIKIPLSNQIIKNFFKHEEED